MDQGIIFLHRIDPLSKIILRLMNAIEFSHLGFYYTTSISGVPRHSVIYFDLFGLEYLTSTLEEVKSNPLTKRIMTRRLEVDPIYFRAVLAEKLVKPPDILLVNLRRILKLETEDDEVDEKEIEEGKKDENDKKEIEGTGNEVKVPTDVVRSVLESLNINLKPPFLDPHPFLSEIQEIPVPMWSETEVELNINTTLIQQRTLLHKLGGVLLELSLRYPNSGIWISDSSNNREDLEYRQAVKSLQDQSKGWLESIRKNETIWIAINPLLSVINVVSKNIFPEIPLLRSNGSYSAVLYTSGNLALKKLPIILRSGSKIELPLHNPNLTGIEEPVLQELLEVLENLSAGTTEYDELREAISEQLASK